MHTHTNAHTDTEINKPTVTQTRTHTHRYMYIHIYICYIYANRLEARGWGFPGRQSNLRPLAHKFLSVHTLSYTHGWVGDVNVHCIASMEDVVML